MTQREPDLVKPTVEGWKADRAIWVHVRDKAEAEIRLLDQAIEVWESEINGRA